VAGVGRPRKPGRLAHGHRKGSCDRPAAQEHTLERKHEELGREIEDQQEMAALRPQDRHMIFSYAMSKLLSVSVPDELVAEAEALARVQGKTKSEVVREALRRYLQLARFRELQTYGRAQAEKRGIGPDDAELLVDEVRARRD
jgi:CopG family transcriptional regulator/antitoxin EndoAI